MSGDWNLKGSLYYRGTSGGTPVINHQHQGGNIHEEISDVSRWANQYLGVGGYSDQLITDLATDMADGITLLRLVQALSDSSLPEHKANPMIRVHKLENIQICLNFLKQQGVQITAVYADDIVGENKKVILSLCHALRRHYTAGPSPKTSRGSRDQHKFRFSSLDKDDIAILSWVGKRVGRDIHDYTALYDGRVLCELMNEIEEGAIPQEVIYSGTAEQRLKQALTTGQKNFFIGHGSLNAAEIAGGREDSGLKSYLQQCKLVYQQSVSRRGAKASSTTLTRPMRSPRGGSSEREGAGHHPQTPTSSSLESREAAKIALRTYEGIQQRKLANGESHAPPSGHHSSHEQLAASKPQPHSSKRPLSDIYVSGASSYTDLSTTRSEHKEMVRKHPQQRHHHPISKQSSSSTESLDHGPPVALNRHHSLDIPLLSSRDHGGSGSLPPGPASSTWQRHSAGYESDSSTGSTLLRSHSQGSITADTALSGHMLASYGGGRGRGGGGVSAALANRSLTRSIDSVNTPTFDPPNRSGSMVFRRAPSYSRLDSGSSAAIADELGSHVDDLEERVGLLAMQFLYERHDMFKQIHAALVKERRKRQALERRTKELERLSRQAVRHYDARLIEMASEVSRLRGELLSVGRGKSSAAPSVTMEIGQLKDQVNKLMEQKNSAKNVGALLQFPKRSTKQSLFMRKRATSDLSGQSNPSISSSSATHRHSRQRGRSIQRPPSPTQDLPSPSSTAPTAAGVSQKPGPFLLGSATSFKKLSNFFGVEPPRVQNLSNFLEELGYPELLPVFDSNGVGLAELSCMSESHLEQLGVPFGQRIRILKEIQQLQPLEAAAGNTKATHVI